MNDDDKCICDGCGYEHLHSERVRGKVDSFGTVPLLCPKCGEKWYMNLSEKERLQTVIKGI